MSKSKKIKNIGLIVLAILLILTTLWLKNGKSFAPEPKTKKDNTSEQNGINSIDPSQYNAKILDKVFDKNAFSLTDPNSKWVIVNKARPLNPTDYKPNDLVIPEIPLRNSNASSEMLVRKEVAEALKKMATDAKKESINLLLASGYRSYNLQIAVYNNFVKTQGQETADTQSARPGHSEHQTGLAVDLGSTNRKCEIEDCFADTPEGKWLAKNAFKYGFILRYPPNAQATVGYKFEPWHYRYVGTELSIEMQKSNQLILENFFGLNAAPNYN